MKKQKGITLIALVVTIIVLLILAGVSISMVVGNNGVLTEASLSVVETRKAKAKEEIELAWSSVDSEYWDAWIKDSSVTRDTYFNAENLNKYIGTEKGNVETITYIADGTSTVRYTSAEDKETYIIKIDTTGKATVEGTGIVPPAGEGETTTPDGEGDTTLPEGGGETTEPEVTKYTVTFKSEDETQIYATVEVNAGETVTYTGTEEPTKEHHTFEGWFIEKLPNNLSVVVDLDTYVINQDTTFYPKFIAICFLPGTKVLTENGMVNIEDITVGMKVYSKNEATGKVELKEVLNTFENEVTYKITKVTANGNIIESTDGHEYYEVNKGWTKAYKLEKGDILLNAKNEEVVVEEVVTREYKGQGTYTVYNMEVKDNHNYYVGADCVLVHNRACSGGSN